MKLRLIALIPAIGGLLVLVAAAQVQSAEERPQQVFNRAITDFRNGRIAESAAGFDNLVKIVPSIAPELWQRGIVLYYARRYGDCRAQFESHRTVNPDDVENAAWHFLCVARAESPAKARSALLPVGADSRIPMLQIYEMFQGARRPEDVMAAAGSQPGAQFYAHLYIGLYHEALGNRQLAVNQITAAADGRYESAGGFMHTVAKVHLALLQNGPR